MANIWHAVTQYGPKLELKPAVECAELVEWMTQNAGLEEIAATSILGKVNEAILYFCTQGYPVHIEGLGTFTPTINRIGEFAVEFTADLRLRDALNAEGAYQGLVLNKQSIGWTNDQYKEAWDKDHIGDSLQA